MAEVGARPQVSPTRRRALRAVRALFHPLLPDDYLELINPLWSTRELRGRVERIEQETPDTVTVHIKPGHEWMGHKPGQYLRIGVVVDGVHHWRAYSLTSDPGVRDRISITPKLVDGGVVSPFLVEQAEPGMLVRLGGVEGTFVLPDPPPERVLFISAGSGITPIMSMLRCLDHQDAVRDVVQLHSARTEDTVVFGDELRRLDERHDGYRLHLQITGREGRMGPGDLDRLCPDWRERETYASGPAELLDALEEHFEADDGADPDRFHLERFQPIIGGEGAAGGEGGTIVLRASGVEAESDGSTPILDAGEAAGAELPFGCRMGICHTCVGRLCSGQLRDLRTGEVHGSEGQMVRTCVNAPEGPVELDL